MAVQRCCIHLFNATWCVEGSIVKSCRFVSLDQLLLCGTKFKGVCIQIVPFNCHSVVCGSGHEVCNCL